MQARTDRWALGGGNATAAIERLGPMTRIFGAEGERGPCRVTAIDVRCFRKMFFESLARRESPIAAWPRLRHGRFLAGRGLLATCVAVLTAGVVFAAIAGQGERAREAPRVQFSIPGQPLVTALQAYSQASGVQVLYESGLAAGRRSAPVEGEFSAEAALQILLAGTGLAIRYAGASAITLARAPTEDLPPSFAPVVPDLSLDTLRVPGPADARDRLGDYRERIQSDIQNALKRNARARKGNYSVAVRLWVDGSRTVQRAELFRSTGDPERDAAIAGALRGLVVSQDTPANLPQPIRIMIVVKQL